MERLAKLGFNQSYTYFAWRQSASELREYFTDLATRTVDYFRPNAWPNTPDILTEQLQHGGRAVFVSRAILAATLSANWGIYGPAFELLEHRAVRPGSEEYLDSEKYQLRTWRPRRSRLDRAVDHAAQRDPPTATRRCSTCARCGSTTPTRRASSATARPIRSGTVTRSCAWSTSTDATAMPATSTSTRARSGSALGDDDEFEVHDLLGGGVYRWRGWHNYVDLTPGRGPAHVFAVRRIE